MRLKRIVWVKMEKQGGLLTFEIAWRSFAHCMLLEFISLYSPLQLLLALCKKCTMTHFLKANLRQLVTIKGKEFVNDEFLYELEILLEKMLPNNLVKLIRNNCHTMNKWNSWIEIKFWICYWITKRITLKKSLEHYKDSKSLSK